MGLPVVVTPSGGLPVIVTTTGLPVTPAANGFGIPVTESTNGFGLAVTGVTFAPDVTAPTITSSAVVSNVENTALLHTLTANETVTWAIVGGADLSHFELTGSILRWGAEGVQDFETPLDADANNTYVVQVRATDLASNQTNQTITVTVTNVEEGGAGATIDMNFAAGTISGAAAFTDVLSCSRASTGYAQTAAGTLTSFAANTLRRTDKGLLVEEARTNVVYPSDFGSVWTTVEATITPNAVAAPDGTTTAETLTDNASETRHIVYILASIPSAGDFTYSFYAKAGTASWVQVAVNLGTLRWANFNLATGVVGNKSAAETATIEALANGWYRCSITFTVSAPGGIYVQIAHTNNTDSAVAEPTYTGTGLTFHIWGAQLELGSYPTSYIPTTTAAVTRAADAVTLIGAAATTIDGTDVSAVVSMDVFPDASQLVIFGDSLVGYPIFCQNDTSVAHYGSVVLPKTGLASMVTTASKLGVAWNASGFSVTGQGLAPATSAAAPVNYGTIYLGSDGVSPANWINTYIRQLELWNTRLSDAELQTETVSDTPAGNAVLDRAGSTIMDRAGQTINARA